MDAITKALFTVDEQISGYRIFKLTEDSASTQKYDDELELLYIRWMYIKCNRNDSIISFTARVQTDDAQYYDTDYEVNPKSLARRWRKGLSHPCPCGTDVGIL